MARINAVLDEAVDYGFEGGGGYSTGVTELENGFEDRDSEWKYPKHEYSASFGDIKDSHRDEIINVLHVCRGKRHSFLFKDWNDYTIENQLIVVGAVGTMETIQLYKRYTFGEGYTIRPIQALSDVLRNPVILDENDDPVAGVFNMMTGEFTPTGAWGSGEYRLTCDFYVWVRFDNDLNAMTINSWQANTARVDLVEDKFAFSSTNVPDQWEGEE